MDYIFQKKGKMKKSVEEKRKFNRIPFSYQDNIVGTFTHPGRQDKINTHILNFSMQGLYFTMRKEEWKKLSKDDQIVLLEIRGPKQIRYILNIRMIVARILDYPDLEYFGYGCKFTSFPESSMDQIKRFLEAWFLERRED
jgi:hypothetical protein